MGARIHKMIGYGVWDLQTNGSKIQDLRIDTARLHARLEELDDGRSAQSFINWCNDNYTYCRGLVELEATSSRLKPETLVTASLAHLQTTLYNQPNKLDVFSAVRFHGDTGPDNTFIVRPISYDDWIRRDDIIDYSEAQVAKCSHDSKTVALSPTGLYPLLGVVRYRGWSETRTLRNNYLPSEYSQLIGTWDPNTPPEAEGADLQDLLHNYRCELPVEVVLLLAYLDCFMDLRAFLNQMRPCLATWWC